MLKLASVRSHLRFRRKKENPVSAKEKKLPFSKLNRNGIRAINDKNPIGNPGMTNAMLTPAAIAKRGFLVSRICIYL